MRRERGAQDLCEQGVGGLGGRVERKGEEEAQGGWRTRAGAFQFQSRAHLCPKIIISRHC